MISEFNKLRSLQETVIGILLRNPDLFTTETIEPVWFGKFAVIVEAMFRLIAKGQQIDILALESEIPGKGVLGRLAELQSERLGEKGNYAWYVGQLREQHQGVGLRQAIQQSLAEIEEGTPPKEALSKLISVAMNAQADGAQNWEYDSNRAFSAFVNNLEKTFDAQESGGLGLKLRIGGLDTVLGGLHPSDLCVVGARPSVGKTALGMSMIYNLIRENKRVGFFSVEMPVEQIMQRLVSIDTGINSARLRDADIQEHEWPVIVAAQSKLNTGNFRIFEKPNITISELCVRARAWHANGGLDFLLIDYLTRVKPDKATKNHHLDVGDVVTGMKNLARTLNIPVVVLAQLNRTVEGRGDKRPIMSDLRDSGIIEQEADQILMLHRAAVHDRTTSPDEAEIIVTKNRHGECGIVACRFDANTTRWVGRFDAEQY